MNKLHLAITLVAGFGFVTCIRFLARRGRLSMRYTLGWLLIGLMFLLYPIIVIAADEISDFLGVQQLAIFLGAPMIILVMVCVQLSTKFRIVWAQRRIGLDWPLTSDEHQSLNRHSSQ
jgi:hypothetical protein